MTRRLTCSLALAAATLLASPAWAVVVEFDVRNSSGDAVPGATIQIGDQQAATQPDGKVRLDVNVDAGPRVQAVVTYVDTASGEEVVVRPQFTLREGTLVSIRGTQVDVRVPRLNRPSAPLAGRGFLGGLVGATLERHELNDTGLARSQFTTVAQISGTQVQNVAETKGPDAIAEINRTERKNFRFGLDGGASFVVPLPSVGGRGMDIAASRLHAAGGTALARRSAASRPLDPASQPASMGSGGSWRFYPSVSFGISRTSVDFESLNLQDASFSQTFSGDGLLYGVGGNGVLFPCGSCNWYTAGNYQYWRSGDVGMTRTPGIQALLPTGVRVASDRGEFTYRAHTVRGVVGYAFQHISPWAGVRGTFWRSKLDFQTELDFSQRFGVPATQSQAFTNEYEEDLIQGIAGVDIRVPGSPLFLRLEGATDGDNHAFSMGFGVGFGR